MNESERLIARRHAVVARGVGQFAGPATAAGARGAMLIDAQGRELIDFAGGIGVLNVGHCHPMVVTAIQEQSERLIHACIHVATYEPYVALCEKLASLFPHGKQTKVMLVNSGAEAVENGVKIAKQATGRGSILCFSEAFHGRTLLCATLTSKVAYKTGCGPFVPEVYRLPFPDRATYGDGLSEREFVDRELRRLDQAFVNTVAATDVAAIILEVVQGEAGFVTVPKAYLQGLRRVCDQHGIMLILDEVQSGFCRTGKWAAYQHFDVEPDISTWAKSLGAGMPISAVIGRADVIDSARPGTLGGTYGGNPVACAAALAAIAVMEEENLNERAQAIGQTLISRFNVWRKNCPHISDVRGLGAMQAIEFHDSPNSNKPATDLVKQIVLACNERGLLVIPAGPFGNIVRVLCPLVISDVELERGLDILEEEIMRITGSHSAARTASV